MTASAMVADVVLSPESFLNRKPAGIPTICCLSPRISLGRDLTFFPAGGKTDEPTQERSDGEESGGDYVDFEFRLHDPVTMLHADELFADGKLVPLQLTAARRGEVPSTPEIRSPEQSKARRKAEASGSEAYVFSPRAPSCTRRWRELLGFKKAASTKSDQEKVSAVPTSKDPNPESRPRRHFFHRIPKSSLLEPPESLPLLRDSDSESLSISSRLSLSSSSSSGPDYEDIPRLSLDTDKPSHHIPMLRLVRPVPNVEDHGRVRTRRTASSDPAPTTPPMAVPADSPRMNPSGKIVFHGLERSSSSPGSFTGGPRPRTRGVERSHSANVVRVTPVLNVPVCSLRGSAKSGPVLGFRQLFSPHKKDKSGSPASSPAAGGGGKKSNREKGSNSRN